MSNNSNGPKLCSYKITQEIMDNPEAIAKIAEDAKAKEAAEEAALLA